MDNRIILNDFEKALGNLEAAISVPAETDLERAGCIQYFGFCFESDDVPGEYIWNIFTEYGGMQPRETICPAYWLQLPHYPISE